MLSEGFGHAEEDMAERALREAQVDADRLLARSPPRSLPTGSCFHPKSVHGSTAALTPCGACAPGLIAPRSMMRSMPCRTRPRGSPPSA